MMGKSCCHTPFVGIDNLEECGHCNTTFCPPCLLGHKVFLRLEAGMIASSVSNFSFDVQFEICFFYTSSQLNWKKSILMKLKTMLWNS